MKVFVLFVTNVLAIVREKNGKNYYLNLITPNFESAIHIFLKYFYIIWVIIIVFIVFDGIIPWFDFEVFLIIGKRLGRYHNCYLCIVVLVNWDHFWGFKLFDLCCCFVCLYKLMLDRWKILKNSEIVFRNGAV